MTFSTKESLCINRANSLLMLLIVLMHCVVSNDVPYAELFYVCIFRTFTRVAVPVFFLMSGYLLLNNYSTSKIRKRVDTVLIPYILWSLLSVGFFLLMSKMPVVSNYINADIKFSVIDILRRTLISPINGALWFLRDLFLLICLSPIINKYLRNNLFFYALICVIFVIWLTDGNYTFFVESSLFFLIGAKLAIKEARIFKSANPSFANHLFVILYVVLCVALSALCVNYKVDEWIITKVCIILGFFVVLHLKNILVQDSIIGFILDKFKKYSFFVYGSHLIVAQIIKKLYAKILPPQNNILYLLFEYIIVVLATIFLCIVIQWILNRFCPKIVLILTGNRN